ncbi:MAG: hypothetical protein OXH64_09320 [Rhodospirillaceae bacterium]|nr:hypothetical protein [Rhodospirillaceae bacterium]
MPKTNAERQAEYRRRQLADPEKAARFRKRMAKAQREWRRKKAGK